jgi:hypothetical protein
VLDELRRLGLVRQVQNKLRLDVRRNVLSERAVAQLSTLVLRLLTVVRRDLRTASYKINQHDSSD